MEGKDVGAIMCTIFFILMCTIIGSCFTAFVYEDKKISFTNPNFILAEGISVFDKKNKQINSLKLTISKTGLKPATGREDMETDIPSTVTPNSGTEGIYGDFFLKSQGEWKLYVTNIKVESKQNSKSERKHIKVGLDGVKGSAKTLEDERVLICSGKALQSPKKFTLLVWLHGNAGNSLIGAHISFDLEFEKV